MRYSLEQKEQIIKTYKNAYWLVHGKPPPRMELKSMGWIYLAGYNYRPEEIVNLTNELLEGVSE